MGERKGERLYRGWPRAAQPGWGWLQYVGQSQINLPSLFGRPNVNKVVVAFWRCGMFWVWGRLPAVVVVALAIAVPQVRAADEQIGAFLVVEGVDDHIALVGEITVNSPLDFRRAVQRRPSAHTLITASPGGMVASALIIAQDLNERGMGTYIPADLGCYSACAYIFLAGTTRLADGELGVHQMAADIQDNSGVQLTVSDMLDTLLQFDTPSEVISRMLRTPNEEMYVFSSTELETLGINRIGADVGDVVDNTTPPALPKNRGTGPRLAIYEGLDFYGEDVSSGRVDNLVECARACLGDSNCQAFTFNANPKLKSGPNCFLKEGVGRLEGYEEAISGLLLRDPAEDAPTFSFGVIDPTRDVQAGTRFSGENLPNLPPPGTSLGVCRQTCTADESCAGFTYRTATRQCLLKEELGVSSAMRGYSSGTKRLVNFGPSEVIALE